MAACGITLSAKAQPRILCFLHFSSAPKAKMSIISGCENGANLSRPYTKNRID